MKQQVDKTNNICIKHREAETEKQSISIAKNNRIIVDKVKITHRHKWDEGGTIVWLVGNHIESTLS